MVTLIGCAVLAGWAFGIVVLRSVVPGLPEMVPNTALAFVLTGIALRLCGETQIAIKIIAQACALAVVALGLVTAL